MLAFVVLTEKSLTEKGFESSVALVGALLSCEGVFNWLGSWENEMELMVPSVPNLLYQLINFKSKINE